MKLTTGIRKRFRVSNKAKKVASKDRFRLCISRSSKNISAQIIDDIKNITLMSASSVEKQTVLRITGSDKQQVGTVASKIKTFRKIEPYKGKGVREQGQYVLKKEGKNELF